VQVGSPRGLALATRRRLNSRGTASRASTTGRPPGASKV
jgi:hypothetical protein